ncbi:DsbA family protein [Streptomyces sp. NPDC085927]|uniref:DsbA family protein n=1 Tax=Streptomyces sp. NPDC085927 TaxID=3365738 RepID=UPI0037D03E9C
MPIAESCFTRSGASVAARDRWLPIHAPSRSSRSSWSSPRPVRLRPDVSSAGEPLIAVWSCERGAVVAVQLVAGTSFGADDGLELSFHCAVFAHTFDAHRLAAQASGQGKAGERAERLFCACFTDGLSIADPAVLARLAAGTGVMTNGGGADAMHAALARVRGLDLPAPSCPGRCGRTMSSPRCASDTGPAPGRARS